MDFTFSEDQRSLKETIRHFAQKEIQPLIKESDEKGQWPDVLTGKLAELGLLVIVIPPEYSGCGYTNTDYVIILVIPEAGALESQPDGQARHPLRGFSLLALPEVAVGFITLGVDLARIDGDPHSATRLVNVRAVIELAIGHQMAQLWKVTIQLCRVNVP